MNKKIFGIFVAVLAVVMLATPAFASPTKGNKVAVTLMLVRTGLPTDIDPPETTGPITHAHISVDYEATIIFEDGYPDLVGTLATDRKVVQVPQKEGQKWIFTDYYEFTFGNGGFEGNAKVIMDGVVFTATGMVWEKSRSNYLFHGTGDFEGQTLNFNHPWNPFGGGVPGTPGYWLKYEP
jgi:hypothetical protein